MCSTRNFGKNLPDILLIRLPDKYFGKFRKILTPFLIFKLPGKKFMFFAKLFSSTYQLTWQLI